MDVELTEVIRGDDFDSLERGFAYTEYLVLKFIVNNSSDEHKQAYKDVVKTLQEHFTEQELQEILPQ